MAEDGQRREHVGDGGGERSGHRDRRLFRLAAADAERAFQHLQSQQCEPCAERDVFPEQWRGHGGLLVDERHQRQQHDECMVLERRRRSRTEAEGRDDQRGRRAALQRALRARCEADKRAQLSQQRRRHDHRSRHGSHVDADPRREHDLGRGADVCGKSFARRVQRLAAAEREGTSDAQRLHARERGHARREGEHEPDDVCEDSHGLCDERGRHDDHLRGHDWAAAGNAARGSRERRGNLHPLRHAAGRERRHERHDFHRDERHGHRRGIESHAEGAAAADGILDLDFAEQRDGECMGRRVRHEQHFDAAAQCAGHHQL